LATLVRIHKQAAEIRRMVVDARKARDLSRDVEEALERISDAESSLKRLHSRAGMREVRARRAGAPADPTERPDPESQPEAWRQWAARQRAAK
jgi:hypothetical protein